MRADAGGTCEGSTIAAGPQGGTLIFSTPFHDTKRANMTVFTSKTAGKSWEVWQNIDPGPSAYSALVALSESSVGLVYESRGYLLRQTFLFDPGQLFDQETYLAEQVWGDHFSDSGPARPLSLRDRLCAC